MRDRRDACPTLTASPHAVKSFFRGLHENLCVRMLPARASLLPRPLELRFAGQLFSQAERDGSRARRAAEIRAGFLQRIIRQPDRLGLVEDGWLLPCPKQNPFPH